jgi:hypothetical protein
MIVKTGNEIAWEISAMDFEHMSNKQIGKVLNRKWIAVDSLNNYIVVCGD